MKKPLFTTLALAGAFALTAPLLAGAQGVGEQRGEGQGAASANTSAGEGRHGSWHARHGARHGGALAGPGFGPRALHGLDLSEAQRDRLFELRHAQAPALREQGKVLREARRELRELSMSDAYDEAKAREISERAAGAASELSLLRARGNNEAWKLLTAEQREKLGERAARGDRHGMAGRQSRS